MISIQRDWIQLHGVVDFTGVRLNTVIFIYVWIKNKLIKNLKMFLFCRWNSELYLRSWMLKIKVIFKFSNLFPIFSNLCPLVLNLHIICRQCGHSSQSDAINDLIESYSCWQTVPEPFMFGPGAFFFFPETELEFLQLTRVHSRNPRC